MVWTSATLSTDEIAWAADDKPILASNALYGPSSAAGWDVGTLTGTVASAVEDATGYEAERVFDGLPDRVSKGNANSTWHSIVFDRSDSPIEFDFIGILNSNLFTLNCTQFKVEIDDNSTFSDATSKLETILDVNIDTAYSAERRYCQLELYHTGSTARRYTGVEYIRISLITDAGQPQIGQLIFGRRRQQRRAPELGWDPTNQHSTMNDVDTPDGCLLRTARRKGRREINATFRHDGSHEWGGGGYPSNTLQDDLLAWWDDIEWGRHPFVWIDEPNSAPDDFWLMLSTGGGLRYPYGVWNDRVFDLQGVEQGPQAVLKASE